MRILLDQGTPAPLARELSKNTVSTAFEMGWAGLDNGALLRVAEQSFDIFITTDKNLRHQQNLRGRRLAVLVLPTTSCPKIQRHISAVIAAVESVQPGDFHEIQFPH